MSPPARSCQRSSSGYWYSPPDPDRDADTGFGLVLRLKGKRKPPDGGVKHDRPLFRPAGDITVRRQRQAHAQAPALSRPHLRQEPVDVEHHRRRRLAGQHLLEMPRGQRVLALQEESPGKLQADADEAGVRDQHGAEGRDGLVQQRLPLRLGDVRFLRCTDRRHAGLESNVQMPRTCRRQRPQYGQRLFEPARLEQSLRLRDLGRGRPAGRRWRWRLLAGTPCRRGEEQERRGRKHAEEGVDYHRLLLS